MVRRGLALGGALIVVILIVLGVKGCLDARAHRALTDYARNVTQIVQQTNQTSKTFFGKLEEPGSLSVREFVNQVNADKSEMDGLTSRVDALSAPGDMSEAQRQLELVYELRSRAMDEIANRMSTALGSAGADRATAAIARQMQTLLAADVVYEQVARPDVDSVLEDNGINDSDVPKGTFLPDTKWLEESTVSAALGGVSGAAEGETAGVHGLGLLGVSLNGTELADGAVVALEGEETPELEVRVQNQGESSENEISVKVKFNGAESQGTIESLGPGEEGTALIPLVPAPSGEVTLEVEVETVPGEQVSENNVASYTITIG
jgi:CARDB